jgi:GntR family transcriptional regulator
MFSLNPQSGIPIYRQLVEQVRHLIASNQLKSGDELPSVRELALLHTVSPMTISKAYGLLETEGFLLRQRGKAMRVAEKVQNKQSKDKRLSSLTPDLTQTINVAKQLDLKQGDVVKLFNQLWKKL